MKIAYIAPAEIPSSTANSIQVMKVCQALTQLGHETSLIVPGSQNTSWQDLSAHYGIFTRFPIHWLPARKSLRKLDFAWAAVHMAKKQQSKVIYTRLYWVAVLALQQKMPVILEMHELPSGRFGPWLYRRYLHLKGQKFTVFITHALKTLIEKSLNVHHAPDQFYIAPDGVDLERYASLPSPVAARSSLDLQELPTVAYSGGFYPGRGLEILFDLARALPQIQFLWVGGKPAIVEAWREKVTAAGLKNVRLTGFISNHDLPLYQAAADVLLMPYSQKVSGSSGGDISSVTSPMKLFEYMACGRVIVSADLSVLHEVLNDANAVFYPPDDLIALTGTITDLLNNPEHRQRLAEQARQDVVQYSWQARMESILAHFEQNQLEQSS